MIGGVRWQKYKDAGPRPAAPSQEDINKMCKDKYIQLHNPRQVPVVDLLIPIQIGPSQSGTLQ